MNKLTLVLALFLCTSILFAQKSQDFTISGKVVDKAAGVPLEYATITVKDRNNAQDVEGGITDPSGNFSVSVPAGDYSIKIEYISFQPIILQRSISEDLNLGTIQLEFAASDLEEVTVVAETTTVDVRLDKKIYNIGKDLTTAGGTVSDALNNVPSVSVDVEGGISLRGNENVRILINGKPSALAGFGSTDVLGQLPADAIERVEVITSPSARYDAEGTAGILNIILRKEKTLGFNGSFQASGGTPTNASITSNLNYRTNKFNIFNTLGYRYRESPGNGFFDTRYFNERQDAFLDSVPYNRNIEDREYDRQDRGFNGNLGLEYYITDMSSITGSFFYRKGMDEDVTRNTNDYFLDNNRQIGTQRRELETEDDESYQFALNYMNKFDENGHQLTADFQYDVDSEVQEAFISEPVLFQDPSLTETINIPREETNTLEDQKEYLLQADYVLPLGEDSQFEAGYRGNWENTVTDYELRQEDSNGLLQINENQTNIFDYTENVQALYTQYGTKFGDFSFLAGLRLENTNLKGDITSILTEQELQEEFSFPINTNFDNNYLGLFPTLNIIYELGEEENITLGYNRRINRPRGWYINPFPSRSSRTNIFQGNPNLRPAFSNAFDLGYLKRWDKITLTSSVYYQRETDAFQRVQEEVTITGPSGNDVEVIRSIPFNLATNDRTGAEAGILYNPAKWLRLNGSINFFQFNLNGSFNGEDYSRKNSSWFGRFSSKVTLPGAIDWQTNAFYRGASQEIQGSQDGILSIDLALSKELFDGSTTISANVSDLLNSRKRNSFTTTEFFEQNSEFQWRQRQINFSVIYRFNQQREERKRPRQGQYGDDDGEFEG
ncbi:MULTISPECIES: TonB-dependent receptor [unclassified Leeuwenhoekiella]|uniref:TonB-dependent receptor domain-containing protein n=1 Tax=unclassified Leeuwenhoekiella TaxID=2615029 RepID=UPI000C4BF0C2|nr:MULTISPECIES: TonB-dependent receptor [unclassified Leeuwenhoekiella]MAW95268.1 TonB-dependent receptor [Leeuwenhoekiella sp.]MBA81809.1 TonB-dependent receptor [Leeuwenhoekiella sp.]|tara:strand:- start:9172 stop:11688 length:2517 start_codon:yes stop_codon:yes gene_type:complete